MLLVETRERRQVRAVAVRNVGGIPGGGFTRRAGTYGSKVKHRD